MMLLIECDEILLIFGIVNMLKDGNQIYEVNNYKIILKIENKVKQNSKNRSEKYNLACRRIVVARRQMPRYFIERHYANTTNQPSTNSLVCFFQRACGQDLSETRKITNGDSNFKVFIFGEITCNSIICNFIYRNLYHLIVIKKLKIFIQK